MKKEYSDRGSALLIATIVVLLAVGIGGAFVAVSVQHSKEQAQVIEADEAMTMCDAGMDRARQAIGVYVANTSSNAWTLDQMFQYCYNNLYPNPSTLPVDATLPPDPRLIKADYLSRIHSAQWNYYESNMWGANATINLGAPGLPLSLDHVTPTPPGTSYPSGDPGNGVVLGWNIPFHRGAIHIYVRNNVDSAATTGTPPHPACWFHDSDTKIMVTVTATLPSGLQRQVDGTISAPPPTPGGAMQFKALGAVVANDSVNTNGNTSIDGRDYGYDPKTGATGLLTGNPGVFGIVSDNSIGVGGSSGVGGNGSAPPSKGAAAGSTASSFVYPGGYPPTPDALMGQPSGTMKATAQSQGTYCASATDYTNLLAANGGKLPDHAIVYLDFTPGSGVFELGSGNTLSSILVVHTDTYTGTISEVHGSFTGAIFADSVVRVNAGTQITGMIQLFSPTSSAAGNVLGNGNSSIQFSSAALSDLPAANGGTGTTAPPLLASRRIL